MELDVDGLKCSNGIKPIGRSPEISALRQLTDLEYFIFTKIAHRAGAVDLQTQAPHNTDKLIVLTLQYQFRGGETPGDFYHVPSSATRQDSAYLAQSGQGQFCLDRALQMVGTSFAVSTAYQKVRLE